MTSDTQAVQTGGESSIDIRDVLRQHRGLLWCEGFTLLLGGIALIIYPLAGGMVLETLLGVIALLVGGASLLRGCLGGCEHRGSVLVTGFLAAVLGVALLVWPLEGLEAMVLLLAAFCLLRGIADLAGIPARSQVAPVLQIISGLAGVVLATLLLVWYPHDVLWVPGLLFGIELMFLAMPVLAVASAVSVRPARRVDVKQA